MQPKAQQPSAKRRLKDSCNSCGTTKVKCDKAKPKCARCDERGIACHYSPSQRSGRRSAASSVAATPSTKPTLLPNDNIHGKGALPTIPPSVKSFQKEPGSSVPENGCQAELHPNEGAEIECAGIRPDEIPMPSMLDESLLNAALISPINMNAFDNLNIDCFDSIDGLNLRQSAAFDKFPTFVNDIANMPALTPLTPISLHDPCQNPILEPRTNILDQKHSCLTLASNILSMLHIPSSTCTTTSAPGVGVEQSLYPTFDYVISTNKAIIEMTNDILNCSCSLDEQLASILSLVAFKLMAWYSAAAREVDGESLSETRRSSEKVLYLPVMVGKYQLDGNDARWLRAQLILSELQRMGRLVNLISKRFQEVSLPLAGSVVSGEPESPSGNRWLSSSIFRQLETDLRRRLESITEETTSILRGSHGQI